MNSMIRSIPALADLAQDIANGIPPELMKAWASGERSETRAELLLAPYRRDGAVVVSDTVGLSRLSRERKLETVLRMISRPKQIIHALGTTIGGEPVGVWVADNSEMFFEPAVSMDEIVSAMVELHSRLPAHSPKVGLCIHQGRFYHIGGGLYGPDADLVEVIAEDESRGGETLITGAALAALRHPERVQVERRHDLAHRGEVYRVLAAPPRPDLQITDTAYPMPYHPSLRPLLGDVDEKQPGSPLDQALTPYHHTKTLLVVQRCSGQAMDSPAALLDELLHNLVLHFYVTRHARRHSAVAKVGGALGILAVDEVDQALDIALQVRADMASRGLTVRAGIDSGSLLIFPLQDGRREFAGDPLNIAAKQAEDCGVPGWIYLTERAAAGLELPDAQFFEWHRSNMVIRSLGLPPETLPAAPQTP